MRRAMKEMAPAALRPVAVGLTLTQPFDAGERVLDLVVEESVVYVLVTLHAQNLAPRLHRVRDPLIVRNQDIEDQAHQKHRAYRQRHCPADGEAVRRKCVDAKHEVGRPTEEIVEQAPTPLRVIAPLVVVQRLLLPTNALIIVGVGHHRQSPAHTPSTAREKAVLRGRTTELSPTSLLCNQTAPAPVRHRMTLRVVRGQLAAGPGTARSPTRALHRLSGLPRAAALLRALALAAAVGAFPPHTTDAIARNERDEAAQVYSCPFAHVQAAVSRVHGGRHVRVCACGVGDMRDRGAVCNSSASRHPQLCQAAAGICACAGTHSGIGPSGRAAGEAGAGTAAGGWAAESVVTGERLQALADVTVVTEEWLRFHASLHAAIETDRHTLVLIDASGQFVGDTAARSAAFAALARARVVFVYSHLLPPFFQGAALKATSRPIVLMSHNGDDHVSADISHLTPFSRTHKDPVCVGGGEGGGAKEWEIIAMLALRTGHISRWWAQNSESSHPLISPLPIGINESFFLFLFFLFSLISTFTCVSPPCLQASQTQCGRTATRTCSPTLPLVLMRRKKNARQHTYICIHIIYVVYIYN